MTEQRCIYRILISYYHDLSPFFWVLYNVMLSSKEESRGEMYNLAVLNNENGYL